MPELGGALSQNIELSVELAVEGLQPTHRAHQAAVSDFIEYANETPGVSVDDVQADAPAGTKGGWEPLVLSVASPTAAGVVTMFRLWLRRDRRRSVKVTLTSPDGPPVEVEASGENISLDALKAAVESAIKASSGKKR